jgi:MoaA/NifB/PqqE/SkfB family radical SAM enzyme
MSIYQIGKNIYFKKDPLSIVHFLTNRCNARCSFCFIDLDDPKTFMNELSLEEIKKITLKLPQSIINVNFTGGEPFARKDINEIAISYFENTSIESIFITSNGSLPDRMIKFCEIITSKFPSKKLYFSISIDDFSDKHNKIRKLDNLFNKCIKVYHELRQISKNIQTNIAITVSHENYNNVTNLYKTLKEKYNIKTITAILAREEGVYKIESHNKLKISKAYNQLTKLIKSDLKNIKNAGYQSSMQSKVMNTKNIMVYDNVYKTSTDNEFISTCYAGSLFGIIMANGDIAPCEILDQKFGNLRDYNYDLKSIWQIEKNKKFCKKIKDEKCFCTYECAWTFNILGNKKYHPTLVKAIFKN